MAVTTHSIDITTEQQQIIVALFEKHLPGVPVWVYGSRISGTARGNSDLDLVVFASNDRKRAVSDLKEALEESSLPFRVDLFIWNDVPESFKKNIQREHRVLIHH
ncbi:MAG: nucleotidyltransferase domain-containing protein [Burkholderiales bacterium]|nr:nucleotidyltransferase domain-containing protein [Nitrosomonas sp.]MCP5274828.1 nucleotidyltransferase domain-containing protein [Burkholderiales bacterium]